MMKEFIEAYHRWQHSWQQLHVLACKFKNDSADMTEEQKRHLEECYRILLKELRTNFMDMEQENYNICKMFEGEMEKYAFEKKED